MAWALLCAGVACTPMENGENKEKNDPAVAVAEITLDGTSVSILVGENATIKATVAPENAGNKQISWSSSNESVAKVDGSGVVKAIARGKADIVASSTDGSQIKASCEFIVSNPCPEGAIDMGTTTPDGFRFYWAVANLTADGRCNNTNEYGDFFAWGESEPYYASLDPYVLKEGKADGYFWTSYKWYKGGTAANPILSKYCHKADGWGGIGEPDAKTTLDPEDDTAHVLLGGNWRMPTNEEYAMLKRMCEGKWITENGINGMKMTSTNGNTLFFPASEHIYQTDKPARSWDGSYWTSTLTSGGYMMAHSFNVSKNGIAPSASTTRCLGLVIRPVSD